MTLQAQFFWCLVGALIGYLVAWWDVRQRKRREKFRERIGTLTHIQLTHGGAGNQVMTIDGIKYATWADVKEWPEPGERVRHRPYEASDGRGGKLLATDILEIFR